MKITKQQLKELIKEELRQEGILDKLAGGKAALQKKLRSKSGSARAGEAGGLAATEVDVAAALEEILGLLQQPGNQAAGSVKTLVSKLLGQVKGQVKNPPPAAIGPPPTGVNP